MKKQLFALIACALFVAQHATATTSVHHGHTALRTVAPFESGSAMRASIFNSESVNQHCLNANNSGFQVAVFGGKNTQKDSAAQYFMPYGHKKYTIQGQQTFTKDKISYDVVSTATDLSGGTSTADFATATVKGFTPGYDTNTDSSYIRPWNFGVTFAATYDPYANDGLGYHFSPQFKSAIAPEFHRANAGVAASFRHHFSDDPQAFWFEASTAVEWVKTEVKLNEKVETEKLDLNSTNFATNAGNNLTAGQVQFAVAGTAMTRTSTVVQDDDTMKREVGLVWINYSAIQDNGVAASTGSKGTYWPAVETTIANTVADVKNLTQAFTGTVFGDNENKTWKYGKIAGKRTKTRVADIELKIGRNFVCEPSYRCNGYFGVVVPTGNKQDGEFLGEALVGNGRHFAVMLGGSTELELSSDGDWTVTYRADTNTRYLFRNTQTRSFDLHNNEWSRYMMVWDKEDWVNAQALYSAGVTKYSEIRNYKAGINVFTKDMYVTPGMQGRFNQALVMSSEKTLIELGWNIFAREAEKVSLTKAWSENIAFPDVTNSPLKTSTIQVVQENKSYLNGSTVMNATGGSTWNADAEVTEKMINLDSAASPRAITHTPYVSLNYAWGDVDSDRPGYIGIGGSYEFSQGNAYLNQWQLWGKLGFNF